MNGVSGFTNPEVNGTFNGWCEAWSMTDADGDNIWEFTALLAPGTYDFKYSADNWSIQENLDTTLSCVNWVLDSNLAVGYAANDVLEVISSHITFGCSTMGSLCCYCKCIRLYRSNSKQL